MDLAGEDALPFRIGVVTPSSGPAGIYGPSSTSCAQLAVHQINAGGGILGRNCSLIYIDGGQQPTEVATVVRALLQNNVIDAVIGMHDSDVLRAVVKVTQGKIPYVYTAPYEGGEQANGFFCVGETGRQQIDPAIDWLHSSYDIKRWYLLGNDYSWPRALNEHARNYLRTFDTEIVSEKYVPFYFEEFDEIIDDISDKRADAVLISLIGTDSVSFNRAFGDAGLANRIIRFGPLIEENTLLALGADNTEQIFSMSGYLFDIPHQENRQFKRDYRKQFGSHAPTLTALGEGSYEGISFLKQLIEKAGAFSIDALEEASEGMHFSSPRGAQVMRAKHTVKDMYLTKANELSFVLRETFAQSLP